VSEKNGSAAGKPDLDTLRAEIRQTRADLGETVQALAAKADVKARAKESMEQTKANVKAQVAETTGKVTEAVKGATHSAVVAVRGAASGAAVSAKDTAGQAGGQVQVVGEQVRRNPIPLFAVLAGVAAVVGVILIVRGSRR
jgi:O6-methylguanine-DNA--protein-cysteine methyltransferase